MTLPRRPVAFRLIASLMLAAAPPALIGLPLVPVEHQASHCQQPVEQASLALIAAAPHGSCGHAELGPCQVAVGCSSPVMALDRVTDALGMTAVHPDQPDGVARLVDLNRVGPPTPPPNS